MTLEGERVTCASDRLDGREPVGRDSVLSRRCGRGRRVIGLGGRRRLGLGDGLGLGLDNRLRLGSTTASGSGSTTASGTGARKER